MNVLYTFGYQGASLESFVKWVVNTGAVVVDTRMSPFSPRPEWRSISIWKFLPPGRYKHVSALGNTNYKSGGPIQIADPEAGVPVVVSLLEQSPVVLLCACKDPSKCHRSVVADLVAQATGVQVVHLTVEEVAAL